MGSYTPPQALLGLANTWIGDNTFFPSSGKATVFDRGVELLNNQGLSSSGSNLPIGGGGSATVPTLGPAGVSVGGTPASSSPTIASGTVYQNTTGRYVFLYIPVTYSPTTTAAATAAFALGASSAPSTIFTNSEPAGITAGRVDTLTLSIPPGWYYSLTVTNATIGTPTEVQQ